MAKANTLRVAAVSVGKLSFAVSRRWAITKAARAQAMKSKTPSTLREALRQPENVAAGLSVSERLLLFCIASHTDWQKAGVTGTTVTAMMVRGLIERNAGGRLSPTNEGREVLAALLLGGLPSR
jgi:hypothetical protein